MTFSRYSGDYDAGLGPRSPHRIELSRRQPPTTNEGDWYTAALNRITLAVRGELYQD